MHSYSTHRTNANFLRDIRLLINVDFVEPDAGVLRELLELLEYGANHLAWATPRRCEVDYRGLVAIDLAIF